METYFSLKHNASRRRGRKPSRIGISFTEFSYQVHTINGLLAFIQEEDVQVQIGGADQWEHHFRA